MVNSVPKSVKLSGAAGVAGQEYIYNDLGEVARTEAFVIVPNVSVSTHAADYVTITVKKGATTLATFTTNSAGGAAMTAGTPITMTLGAGAVGSALELASAGVFDVACAAAGGGKAYDAKIIAALRGIRQ